MYKMTSLLVEIFFLFCQLAGPLKNHEFIFLCLLTTLGLPDIMFPITPSNCNHFPPLKSNKKNSFWNIGDQAANTNLYAWKLFPSHVKNNIWTFHIFQQHTKMLSPQRKGNLISTLIEVIIGQFLLALVENIVAAVEQSKPSSNWSILLLTTSISSRLENDSIIRNPWEWKECSCSRLGFPEIPMAADIGGWVVVDIGLVEEMMDGVRWWVLGTEECREEPKHGQTWK